MNRGFKFLIQPTKDQQQKFINTFGCCRFVWNKILNDKQEAYKQGIKFNKTLAQYKTMLRLKLKTTARVGYMIRPLVLQISILIGFIPGFGTIIK